MHVNQTRGQQHIQSLPSYLLRSVAENSFRALIEEDDPMLVVNRDDGVVGKVENPGQGMIR